MAGARRFRLSPHGMVVLLLALTMWTESTLAFTLRFGALVASGPVSFDRAWMLLRIGSILVVVLCWALGRKRRLFQAIVFATALLTLGLVGSTARVIDVLLVQKDISGVALLIDVVRLAVVNVLTFSIWYWIIDPPGIDETQPSSAPIEILFPQRANAIPLYESWMPRYTDYLYLAFTTSLAFSPTDSLPLTRRAKGLMLAQAAISVITITVIAGSAINILG